MEIKKQLKIETRKNGEKTYHPFVFIDKKKFYVARGDNNQFWLSKSENSIFLRRFDSEDEAAYALNKAIDYYFLIIKLNENKRIIKTEIKDISA